MGKCRAEMRFHHLTITETQAQLMLPLPQPHHLLDIAFGDYERLVGPNTVFTRRKTDYKQNEQIHLSKSVW